MAKQSLGMDQRDQPCPLLGHGDPQVGQQAYTTEVLRARNMQDAHHTHLPVPRE